MNDARPIEAEVPRPGGIGLQNFAPYHMNASMGHCNAEIRLKMAAVGLTTPGVLSVIDGSTCFNMPERSLKAEVEHRRKGAGETVTGEGSSPSPGRLWKTGLAMSGAMRARDNIRPQPTVRDALSRPRRDFARGVLPPMRYQHEQDKVKVRWPAARRFITRSGLNERLGPSAAPVGIVVQGGMDNGVIRALQRLGLADIHGDTVVPLYVLDVTYPLVASGFLALCKSKEAVPVVEEGQPAFIAAAVGLPLSREDPHATP
jgi:hypothetical protein